MGIRPLTLAAALAVVALLVAGCGRSDTDSAGASVTPTGATAQNLAGRIEVDGSSTVGPFVTAGAEDFQQQNSGVQVTVGISGTGGGFERFCAGETDISDASRPIKDDEEVPVCQKNGIEYTEIQIANDGIAVVVNNENDWATCLTVEQLKKIWEPDSKVKSWKDVDPSFPDVELKLYGPGTDSGTFDYFTKEINGEEGRSRSDYSASEDDNVIVQGVAGDKGALGYFGLSYYAQNKDKLKAVAIDGGNGCVEPSIDTAQSGKYAPLSRPLFMYANAEALMRPEVKAFLQYVLDNEREIAQQAQFVPLTDEQLQQAKDALGS